MLEVKITSKQQLIKLLQETNIKEVVAKDLRVPDDINEFKKSVLPLMRSSSVTVFAVAS